MPFEKGKSGNPGGRKKAKPFADALRLAIADAGKNKRSLRKIAEALLDKACDGDTQAIREVADRLDGKVPQALIGDAEEEPIRVTRVELVAPNDDGKG